MSSMKMSILSSRAAKVDQQIKLGGKIRCGIKLLTKAANSNATAVKLYEEGVARRLKFSDIEKQIETKTGMSRTMYPRNTEYFNIVASDFGMPEVSEKILELYGEKRDASETVQLYRFPVVFHSDELNDIYPNKFIRHGGEPSFESHYGDDGQRYCRYLPQPTAEMLAEQKARRIKRPPRREHAIRGICEPGTCDEFLQGQCKFRGRLHFYIPGIPSTGLIGLDTSSEYAAEGIWNDLERIRDALGSIPRRNPANPNAPIFYITKSLEPRSYFDEDGKKNQGFQWVPKLQADIDIGHLLSREVPPQRLPTTPVSWLEAPKGMPDATLLSDPREPARPTQMPPGPQEPLPGLPAIEQLEELVERMSLNEEDVRRYFDIKLGEQWINEVGKIATAVKILGDLSRKGNACAGLLIQISTIIFSMEISSESFMNHLTKKYGRGYQSNEATLNTIAEELLEYKKPGKNSELNYFKAQFTPEPLPA